VKHGHVAKPIGADLKRSCASLPEALGAELTDRRTGAGWSQQKLADLLGYDVSYIGLLERAEKSPTLETLISIATVFEIRLSELVCAAERRVRTVRSR
jgi:transcriptional regulator with XRE-family HTH domain